MTAIWARVRPVSALADVQDQLLRLISERRLVSNDRLPAERDLALMLGVSRATLREALRGVADRGMVEARQGSGWFIQHTDAPLVDSIVLHLRLSEMSLEQMAEVRRLLEPRAAALAAERRTTADVEVLRSHLMTMDPCDNPRVFIDADARFHEAVARAVKNPFFVLAIKPILAMFREMREDSVSKSGAMQQIYAEHREIFEAISLGDPNGAHLAMNRHLDTFVRRWGIPHRRSTSADQPPAS